MFAGKGFRGRSQEDEGEINQRELRFEALRPSLQRPIQKQYSRPSSSKLELHAARAALSLLPHSRPPTSTRMEHPKPALPSSRRPRKAPRLALNDQEPSITRAQQEMAALVESLARGQIW